MLTILSTQSTLPHCLICLGCKLASSSYPFLSDLLDRGKDVQLQLLSLGTQLSAFFLHYPTRVRTIYIVEIILKSVTDQNLTQEEMRATII